MEENEGPWLWIQVGSSTLPEDVGGRPGLRQRGTAPTETSTAIASVAMTTRQPPLNMPLRFLIRESLNSCREFHSPSTQFVSVLRFPLLESPNPRQILSRFHPRRVDSPSLRVGCCVLLADFSLLDDLTGEEVNNQTTNLEIQTTPRTTPTNKAICAHCEQLGSRPVYRIILQFFFF